MDIYVFGNGVSKLMRGFVLPFFLDVFIWVENFLELVGNSIELVELGLLGQVDCGRSEYHHIMPAFQYDILVG